MVYITGDIHGDPKPIESLCQAMKLSRKDIVVILGDVSVNYFGDERDVYAKSRLNMAGATIFCVHGNHENRPQNIESYVEKQWHGGKVLYEMRYPNLLFPIDGEIFRFGNKKAIVIGGAYSVDKEYRLNHHWHWFPDEQPSEKTKRKVELKIEKARNQIDYIFSHTCPFKYEPTECFLPGISQSGVDDSTEKWLDTIEENLQYKAWYCGHWHTDKRIDKMHFLMRTIETLNPF